MLEATGSASNGTLTADSFSTVVHASIPSLVTLLDPNTSQLVLFSLFDPTSGSNELCARSSAEAVLLFAFGGNTLTGTDRKTMLDHIKTSSQFVALAAVIVAEQNINPCACSADRCAKSSCAICRHSTRLPGRWVGHDKSGQADGTLEPLLVLTPSDEIDGMTFVQTASPLGFSVQNVRRRYGSVVTYVIEHTDDTGHSTTVSPTERVGSVLNVPEIRTLLHLPSGWAEVTSETLPLPVVGEDNKTKYELLCLHPVFGGFDPPVFFDGKYAAEVPEWKGELAQLQQAVTLGAFAELVCELLGLGGATFSYVTLSGQIAGLTANTTSIATLLLNAAKGSDKLLLLVESAL